MTKNPFVNALAALLYISLVASLMFYAPKFAGQADTVFIPIAVLSLLCLSAAMMGYLIVLAPLRLYLDGKKKEGVNLFAQTVGVLAGITVLLFILLYSRILH